MNLTPLQLPPDLEAFVERQVHSGKYTSAAAVVAEALKVLREYEHVRQLEHERLRADVQVGLDALDRGKGAPLDIDAIKRELRTRLQQLQH